jgi:SUF system NifU family Fe-S assembly protein
VSESYTETVLDHAEHPRNQGILETANARAYTTNPVCGDAMLLMLRIENGRIAAAMFQTEGCVASQATSSMLTEAIIGKTLAEAEALTHEDIEEMAGGLPASKLHSAALVIGALRRAIAGYRASNK